MNAIEFLYEKSCGVSRDELVQMGTQLAPEITRVAQALTTGYASDYASINLSTDEQMMNVVQAVIEEKKELKPTVLVVIGIGGSNLGARAVHEAVHGTLYNEKYSALRVYWADTVDAQYIHDIVSFIEKALQAGENVLLNVVSKSGTTTETIANFQILLSILKRYKSIDYHRYIVVTTDKDSALWTLAQQEQFVSLEIPKQVGGRYSVLSAAGLFPLGLLGVDIQALLDGARSAMPEYTDQNIFNNPAALSAVMLAAQYKKGKTIHDTFLFSVQLESLGRWYRQLMGESIGKEYNRAGQRVMVGITPTVSIGSTDLHSVGQLYLGGPADKVTTFVTINSYDASSYDMVPFMQGYDQLVENIQGKALMSIMDAIVQGVQTTYYKRELPYVTFKIPENSPWYLGQFLQCKMLEIIYLGYLLEINPFDQPNVELYKEETREILKSR